MEQVQSLCNISTILHFITLLQLLIFFKQEKEESVRLNKEIFEQGGNSEADSLPREELFKNLNNEYVLSFVLRKLTYKYTCPLTVLYAAEIAGNK